MVYTVERMSSHYILSGGFAHVLQCAYMLELSTYTHVFNLHRGGFRPE
jgi:hypothetical protein